WKGSARFFCRRSWPRRYRERGIRSLNLGGPDRFSYRRKAHAYFRALRASANWTPPLVAAFLLSLAFGSAFGDFATSFVVLFVTLALPALAFGEGAVRPASATIVLGAAILAFTAATLR